MSRHPENKALRVIKGGLWMFHCPGCKHSHAIYPEGMPGSGPRWKIHSVNPLTISPSLLVRWEWGEEQTKNVCHSFIKNNQIQFLNDCTHDLAGKTVPLIEDEAP